MSLICERSNSLKNSAQYSKETPQQSIIKCVKLFFKLFHLLIPMTMFSNLSGCWLQFPFSNAPQLSRSSFLIFHSFILEKFNSVSLSILHQLKPTHLQWETALRIVENSLLDIFIQWTTKLFKVYASLVKEYLQIINEQKLTLNPTLDNEDI